MSKIKRLQDLLPELGEQANELLETLKAIDETLTSIGEKYDQLPNEGDLDDYAKWAERINGAFQDAQQAWDELPNPNDIEEYAKSAASIQFSEE